MCCFLGVNNLYLGMEKTRSGRPGLKVFRKLLTITVSRAIFFPGYTREDAISQPLRAPPAKGGGFFLWVV